jgi:hypothetical protein
MKEKLIDKIKKLLALAGNNSNESEAMAAMAKVQELLAENSLSMADIPEGEREDDETVMEDYDGRSRHAKWQTYILLALAQINDCEYFKHRNGTRIIVGRKIRIEIVRSMADYLFGVVEREAEAQRDGRTRKWVNDFKLGMATRINQRLKERYAITENSVATEKTGAIILRNEIDTLLVSKGIRLRTTTLRASYRKNLDGYMNGNVAGNRAGLHNQVRGGRSPSRRMISG